MNKMLNQNRSYLLFVLILFFILYAPILPDYYIFLKSDDNSYGFFVPFIAFYLIWVKRWSLRDIPVVSSNAGLVALLFSMLLFFIGLLGGIEILPRLSMVITIISLVYYNYGKKFAHSILFPLFFLFFLIPVPVSISGFISLPLKMMASKITAIILTSIGIPVLREGNMLYFTNASLEVAEACSGIRSLFSYLMLGSLFGYLLRSSTKKKLILVGLAAPLAFLSNLIRVTGTGLLAHYWGNTVAKGFLHELSGILTFFMGLVILMGAYRFIEKRNN